MPRKPDKAGAKAGKTRPPNRTKWKPGQSGNPKGCPTGSRHRATILAQAMLEKESEAIVRKVIEAAKAGDMPAARLILERLVPPMRERPINVEIPGDTGTAEGVAKAADAILRGVCTGELLPGEAAALAGIIEGRRRTIETEELERRVSDLESRNEKNATQPR